MRWLSQPANIAFPSLYFYCTFRDSRRRHNMFTHLHHWDNIFAFICLFLHELKHIHCNLLCLAFQHSPVNSGVTEQHPTCILASDVSFKHEKFTRHINLHHSDCRNKQIYLHKDFMHSHHLGHEPRLTNSSYT
jgi:hypothetical protein